MNYELLDDILREHGLLCAIAVSRDGHVLARRGSHNDPAIGTLLSSLIGPYGDAKTTFDSLAGQVLPRMFGQGDAFASLANQ